jgi:hypothetical protein
MRRFLLRTIAAIVGVTSGIAVRAEDPPKRFHLFARHYEKKEGTPPPGPPRTIDDTDERAGYPRELSNHIEPSSTPGGIGYYVGGGVPLAHAHGQSACRRPDEGTWGWDETGTTHFRRRVILGWYHGRRYQGGTGAYRTDGPVVPDVIYAVTSKLDNLGRPEEGGEHE